MQFVEHALVVRGTRVFPFFAEQCEQRRFDDVCAERAAIEIGRGGDEQRDAAFAQFLDVGRGHRIGQHDLAIEARGHELTHEVEVAGDDVGLLVILRVFGLGRFFLLLAGRVEKLERQFAGIGQIFLGHLFEGVQVAHGHIFVERKDEIAEEDVSAGIDQCLRHAEAVERANHEHVLAAQIDAEFALHILHGVALERVLETASVDDGCYLCRLQQTQTVAQRIPLRPGIEIHVDAAEADRIDGTVELMHARDRLIELAVDALRARCRSPRRGD